MRHQLRNVCLVALLSTSAIGCALGADAQDPPKVDELPSSDTGTGVDAVSTSDSGTIEETTIEETSSPEPDAASVEDTKPGPVDPSVPFYFGPSGLWSSNTDIESVGTTAFTGGCDAVSASNIIERLAAARKAGIRIILNMTGGSHENYLTGGVFDLSKWQVRMNSFDTPAIRAAVAAGVADGTIVGNSVMDEPNVSGAGDGNTWGPPGTMTKLRVDGLCAHAKKIFPTLPVGVAHGHSTFEPDKSYKVCEFIVDQYSHRFGDVTAFREAGLALGKRDHHAVLFSMNILNGGVQDKDGTWSCEGTGGLGGYKPNCAMTAEQVVTWGKVLGPAGCGLNMWRYNEAFMAKAANQKAFAELGALLSKVPSKACRRY